MKQQKEKEEKQSKIINEFIKKKKCFTLFNYKMLRIFLMALPTAAFQKTGFLRKYSKSAYPTKKKNEKLFDK